MRAEQDRLIVLLPPADGLAAAERVRVRMLVDRALAALPGDVQDAVVLEPASASALAATVELAVRRVGAGGTVCVLGADVAAQVTPALALYPGARGCLLPVPDAEGEGIAAALVGPFVSVDVDLELIGRTLGEVAREAAGPGTVLVLTGGDVLLDVRWRTGVELGAVGPAGTGPVRVVTDVQEVLTFLDAQADLVARGIVPGGPDALASEETGQPVLPDEEDLPAALLLPPVGAVVLDAGPRSEELVGELLERGVPVVAPRSLLVAEGRPGDAVVASWRIRWDVALAAVLRAGPDGPASPPSADVLVLEPGPAYVGP